MNWTEKYATQPEILRYLNWVTDKLDLRRDITVNTKVTSAVLDEQTLRWTVTTGTASRDRAVLRDGHRALSAAIYPEVQRAAAFEGRSYTTPRTGRMTHLHFGRQAVGAIGTGS